MKITANQLKLSKLVSKDQSRDALKSIYHDGKKSVVTNGHYCVINENISIPDEDIKEPVLIKGKPVQGIKTDCSIEEGADNSILLKESTGATLPVEKTEGKFPNYQQIIPDDTFYAFSVDARYMKSICDYIIQCTDKRDMPKIEFNLQKEPDFENYSITIESNQIDQKIKAILMPVRR